MLALKSERAAAAFILDEQSFWLHVWSLRSFFPFFPINLYKSVFSAECLLPFLLVWTHTEEGGGEKYLEMGVQTNLGILAVFYITGPIPFLSEHHPLSPSPFTFHLPSQNFTYNNDDIQLLDSKWNKTRLNYMCTKAVYLYKRSNLKKICMNINDYTIGIL